MYQVTVLLGKRNERVWMNYDRLQTFCDITLDDVGQLLPPAIQKDDSYSVSFLTEAKDLKWTDLRKALFANGFEVSSIQNHNTGKNLLRPRSPKSHKRQA